MLQVWLIDVSQSVEPNHPHGLEFLFRDCRNVSTVTPEEVMLREISFLPCLHDVKSFFACPQFFQKRGVAEAMSACELFNAVSGLNIPVAAEDEAEFISEVSRRSDMAAELLPGNCLFDWNDFVFSCRLWRWKRGTRIMCRGGERKPSR